MYRSISSECFAVTKSESFYTFADDPSSANPAVQPTRNEWLVSGRQQTLEPAWRRSSAFLPDELTLPTHCSQSSSRRLDGRNPIGTVVPHGCRRKASPERNVKRLDCGCYRRRKRRTRRTWFSMRAAEIGLSRALLPAPRYESQQAEASQQHRVGFWLGHVDYQ